MKQCRICDESKEPSCFAANRAICKKCRSQQIVAGRDKESAKLAMRVYRQKADPAGHAIRQEKAAKQALGFCKNGHTPEERGTGDCCVTCLKVSQAQWRQRNKVSERLRSLAYNRSNPEKHRERVSAWKLNNSEKDKARQAGYRKSNPEKFVAYTQKRRAMRLKAIPIWANDFDDFVMEEASELARLRKSVTGFKWHVDHIVPLNSSLVCGFHCAANLQVIPAFVNISKSNRQWPQKA